MAITQEQANQLHPQKQIYVAAWWYKDNRPILCEVSRVHRCNKEPSFRFFNDPPPPPLTDITHVTVKPLSGYSHERFVRVCDIIS